MRYINNEDWPIELRLMFKIGKIIKDARESAGLTQTELATLANRSQKHIQRVECSDRLPSPRLLEILVNVLRLDLTVVIKTYLDEKPKFDNDLLDDLIQDIPYLTVEDISLFRTMIKNAAKKNRALSGR